MRRGLHACVGGCIEGVVAGEAGGGVEGEDLRRRVAVAPRPFEQSGEVLPVALECREERVSEHLLLAAAGGSVEGRRRLECGPRLGASLESAKYPAEMNAAERDEPDV